VRIAVSVVQGAAFGAGLPVVPVSSLQALAQGAAREHGAAAVLSALDARMGEVYWGACRADPAGVMRPLIAERVCAPQDIPEPGPTDAGWHAVGSGWAAYRDALLARARVHLEIHQQAQVHARDVARLAAVLFTEGAAVPAEQALPVYLRDEVAWARPG
jgi:tRNA threonylcarbamoyladenosine biosynthesis protein TsaB